MGICYVYLYLAFEWHIFCRDFAVFVVPLNPTLYFVAHLSLQKLFVLNRAWALCIQNKTVWFFLLSPVKGSKLFFVHYLTTWQLHIYGWNMLLKATVLFYNSPLERRLLRFVTSTLRKVICALGPNTADSGAELNFQSSFRWQDGEFETVTKHAE